MVNKVRNPKVLFSNTDLIKNMFYWKNLLLLQSLEHVSLSSTCITLSFNLRTTFGCIWINTSKFVLHL